MKAGKEGDDRGWDGWMASPTQWTWVWVIFWSWWWTGKIDVLQSMKSHRVEHDWMTELKCEFRLFEISLFLKEWLYWMNFPLKTVFASSHRFSVIAFFIAICLYVVVFYSSLTSSLICWLFSSILFNLHVFVFLQFFSL